MSRRRRSRRRRVVDGNSFVPLFFFSLPPPPPTPFLESRGPGTALLTVPRLAMDCRTVAQCIGVTPGPLCDAGAYACSLLLSLSFYLPTVSVLFVPSFVLSLLRKAKGRETEHEEGRRRYTGGKIYSPLIRSSAHNGCTFSNSPQCDESEIVAAHGGIFTAAHRISSPFRPRSRVSVAVSFAFFLCLLPKRYPGIRICFPACPAGIDQGDRCLHAIICLWSKCWSRG